MSNRSELRKTLMIAIYQYLLWGRDFLSLDQSLNNQGKIAKDAFVQIIALEIRLHEADFIDEINSLLKDWTFDRLGKIEQAILLLAWGEFYAVLNEKAVIINEAVNLAKTYCEADSYKLINATLDNL